METEMSNCRERLFYMDADYEGFMVPISEGGRGPENAREIVGVEFEEDTGNRAWACVPGEFDLANAYRYTRMRHEFLTDDNHEWSHEPGGREFNFSTIRVIKNEKSGLWAFKPWWVDDGPGASWFKQRFRVTTVGMIAAEIVCDLARAAKYQAEADAQRDSIRGRKRTSQLRSFAHSARYNAGDGVRSLWKTLLPEGLLPEPEKIAA